MRTWYLQICIKIPYLSLYITFHQFKNWMRTSNSGVNKPKFAVSGFPFLTDRKPDNRVVKSWATTLTTMIIMKVSFRTKIGSWGVGHKQNGIPAHTSCSCSRSGGWVWTLHNLSLWAAVMWLFYCLQGAWGWSSGWQRQGQSRVWGWHGRVCLGVGHIESPPLVVKNGCFVFPLSPGSRHGG